MKDAADRQLESMFASTGIPDDGFSERIERNVRRRLWIRRLALPVAAIVGGAISIKPLASLVSTLASAVSAMPVEWSGQLDGLVASASSSTSTVVLGLVAAALFFLISRVVSD